MSENELRPCPFCGEIPNPDWTDESYIECTNRKCSLYSYGMSTGDWQTRPIEDDLRKRIAELEAESERFTVHSDIERQDDKSPNDTQTDTFVYGKEDSEVQE